LAAVIYDENFNVIEALLIPHEVKSMFEKLQPKYVLNLEMLFKPSWFGIPVCKIGKDRMKEIEYYNKAKAYLLSFDSVDEKMLDDHINEWQQRKPTSIKALFKAFLLHAQNRQGMPNSIGDIEHLSKVLFDFDHLKIAKSYSDWEALFDAIKSSDYIPPGRMVKSNNRSHWVIYCKAIISIVEFLSAYKALDEFNEFVSGFLTNEQSKLALPLLLSEEIFGFGFALACDFLKENVSPQFIKPDTHINDIAHGLGITTSKKDYQIFKDVEAYCSRIQVTPYAVDKMFWLVRSGNFYLSDVKITSSKHEFIKQINDEKLSDNSMNSLKAG
jgi:hypothetical protein